VAHRPFVTLLLRGEAAMSPVLIDDVMAGSQFEAVRGAEPGSVRSLLVVPLRFRAATIGAVGFASSSSGAFGEADLTTVQRQAAPLALAIGSAVLASSSEELEQQHELTVRSENLGRTALRVHDELAGVITGPLTLEQTQAQLARLLADLLGVDATIVLEASDQVDDLRFSVASAHVRNESLAAAVVPAASRGEITLPSRVVEVLRRGKVTPISTAELRTAPLTVVSLLATGASAGLVPVVFKGRLYAVYLAISLNPSDVIDEQRLERAIAFASHSRVAFI
jgi:transcriptional regulator with GAF, ATPase, and Fis domain